jgi:hypothetical protein
MLDLPDNAYIQELFLEDNRAKNCRKYSFRKKIKNLAPACIEQNALRENLRTILPKEMISIEDSVYGVDYNYKGITIDQKFCFGALGDRTIKIRTQNRQLLNKSKWTMIITKDGTAEFFQTEKLSIFVKKNWSIVQRRLVLKKEFYSEYAVKLDELYAIEEINPFVCAINKEELFIVLQIAASSIDADYTKKIVLDEKKGLCFEPCILALAQSAIHF